jgi:catechol-2,3-dioxygenase
MTRRFDEMVDWYQKVFEAKVQYQNPAMAFLTYDDEHNRFAIANMAVISPDGIEMDANSQVGVNHVGYTFADTGELLETYDRSSSWRYTLLADTPWGNVVMLLQRSGR